MVLSQVKIEEWNQWMKKSFKSNTLGRNPKQRCCQLATTITWIQNVFFFSHFFSSSNFSLKILFIVKLFSKEKSRRSWVTFRRNEHIKKGQSYKIKTEISRGLWGDSVFCPLHLKKNTMKYKFGITRFDNSNFTSLSWFLEKD